MSENEISAYSFAVGGPTTIAVPLSKNTRRIAFSGPMGVGKSSAARVLVQHGWWLLSFADPVRGLAASITGRTDLWVKPLSPEARATLQQVGQAVRTLDSSFWIRRLMSELDSSYDSARIVIDDVRYPNEVDSLRGRGFTVVHVCRQPQCANSLLSDHPSERGAASLDVDSVLLNDGTLDDLAKKVLGLVGR